MTKAPNSKKRILSGMRSTGKLHLGNYVGALANWVKLQDGGQYDCFFFIADWHALTTDYADTSMIRDNCFEVALDWLAAGLHRDRSTMFIQSHVPQHAELHLLLSMITPLPWLERVPTYKEQKLNLKDKDLSTYGFLGYPVLQAADILIYTPESTSDPAESELLVPVGEDQESHLELTREIARKFNNTYPLGGRLVHRVKLAQAKQALPNYEGLRYVFTEPSTLLTDTPKLLGIDGRKMSKSYGNFISLGEPIDAVRKKIAMMPGIDEARRKSGDSTLEHCPAKQLYLVFSKTAANRMSCSSDAACSECKILAFEAARNPLEEMHETRLFYQNNPDIVWDILESGAKNARAAAERTMFQVREAMFMRRPENIYANIAAKDVEEQMEEILNVTALRRIPKDSRWVQIVEAWLKSLDKSIHLEYDKHHTFITSKKKRVGVAAGIEGDPLPERADFEFRDRKFELLVFLVLDFSGHVTDFIVPANKIEHWWKHFPLNFQNRNLSLFWSDSGIKLEFPNGHRILLSEISTNREALR